MSEAVHHPPQSPRRHADTDNNTQAPPPPDSPRMSHSVRAVEKSLMCPFLITWDNSQCQQ